MKTITLMSSLLFLTLVIFSFTEINTEKIIDVETKDTKPETGCYWDGYGNTYSKRGTSCGSDSSLKVYYSNPYTYKVRVALYMRDENGKTKGSPYVIHVAPGRKSSGHKCYSNGRYSVLVSRYKGRCTFPKYY